MNFLIIQVRYRTLTKAFLLGVSAIVLSLLTSVKAQNENNVWYFGEGVGLNFNTTPPTPLANGALKALEGSASISDANGNLLFYTDGLKVYTKQHILMTNGDGLKSGSSSTQSAVILKKPGSGHLYYVFSSGCNSSGSVSTDIYGLHYSIIDMTKSSGYGAIVQKNVQLLKDTSFEKLVAVKDAFGCGFWVITHDTRNGTFYSFHLTADGVNPVPVRSKTGYLTSKYGGSGYLKASSNGKKIAAAYYFYYRVELFDFDNLSGRFSNCLVLDTTFGFSYYGLSFSPNNRYLYVTAPLVAGLSLNSELYQYDISLSTPVEIVASKELIYKKQYGSYFSYCALQLGPDGRIYLSQNPYYFTNYSLLAIIENPDEKGILCSFLDSGVVINGVRKKKTTLGLPNLVESAEPFNLEFDLGDISICNGKSAILDATYIKGDFLWSTGDTSKLISVTAPGSYTLSVSSFCGTYTDTVEVAIEGSGKSLTLSLGSDTGFCGPFTHLLNGGKGMKRYWWSTGDVSETLQINGPGVYSLTVTDTSSCTAHDTIIIDQIKAPDITAQLDTTVCPFVMLRIQNREPAALYTWNTGDTGIVIKVTQAGRYTAKLTSIGCTISTSLDVDTLPISSGLVFNLGKDTLLCDGQKYKIEGGENIKEKLVWNTGDTTNTLIVDTSGIYIAIAHSLCGSYSDSVEVSIGKSFTVHLGNDTAFCGSFRHQLDAKEGAIKYFWNTTDTSESIWVDKPGTFTVEVIDSNFCKTGDTIDIGQLHTPQIKMEWDEVTCHYVQLSIPKPDSATHCLWSTGDTALAIQVSKTGTYSVTLSNQFCSLTSSLRVDKLSTPAVDLGPDTSICEGEPITLNAGNDGEYFMWNTKDTAMEIRVFNEGMYSVTVSRNNCSASDSVWVGPVCDMWYYIPNAFTPGGDSNNDVFFVSGQYIKQVNMQIFNRWGQLIYAVEGMNPFWDGTYKSSLCPEGVYIYRISVSGYKNGKLYKENHRGSVTLLR